MIYNTLHLHRTNWNHLPNPLSRFKVKYCKFVSAPPLTWFPKTPRAQALDTWLDPNHTAARRGGIPRKIS